MLTLPKKLQARKVCCLVHFLQISRHFIALQTGDKDCTIGGIKVFQVHCTGIQKRVDDMKAEIHKLVHSQHMQRMFKQESTH